MKRILIFILMLLIGLAALSASAIKYKGDLESNESVTFPEQATPPANPAATKHKLYIKTDGQLYRLDSGGTETRVGFPDAIVDGDISEAEGILRKTGAGAYVGMKTNLSATVAPGVNDDSAAGYVIGSVWVDITGDRIYQAVDVTVAAAIWKEISAGPAGSVLESDFVNNSLRYKNNAGTMDNVVVAASQLVGRASTGEVRNLTAAESRTILNVENGATADQTNAEIKTAYEANVNTNEFDDAEQSKLDAIESFADVTDAINVNAAGAVMETDFATASIRFKDAGNAMGNIIISTSTIVGRKSTGDPEAMTPANARTVLNVEDGAEVNRVLATQTEAEAGTDNVKSMSPLRTKQAIDALGGGGGGAVRNFIRNGRFDVWDQGAGHIPISPATDTFFASGWRWDSIGIGRVSSIRSTTLPIDDFHTHVLSLDVQTIDTVMGISDFYRFVHTFTGRDIIEMALGKAGARTITISFKFRSPSTGNYSLALLNSAENRSYVTVFNATTANVWQTMTKTIVLDTTGTWLTNDQKGLQIMITYACGTGHDTPTLDSWTATGDFCSSTQANHMASATINRRWTDFKLEIGSTATAYDPRSFTEEIELARYYRYPVSKSMCAAISTSTVVCPLVWNVSKAPASAIPTVGCTNGQITLLNATGGAATSACSNVTVNLGQSSTAQSSRGGTINYSGFTGLTVEAPYRLNMTTAGSVILIDAEHHEGGT